MMSRPLSSSGDKRVQLNPATVRAYMRAKLNAEDKGVTFPSLSEALDMALLQWLRAEHPDAVLPAGPGRPRRAPKKP